MTIVSAARSRGRTNVLVAALGVAVPLTLSACGGSGEEPTPAAQEGGDEASCEFAGDIEWIVPYSPGGGFDTYSRGIAQVMTEGGFVPDDVNIVIRNTTPLPQGITQMFSAEPDGQTVGILPMPAAIAQQIQAPDVAQWETSEFTVLGQVDENAYVVYVPDDAPYQTIEDLVAAENLTSITVEEGSSSALATLATIENLDLDASITYGAEGSAEVVAAALRGDADFFVYGSTDVVGFIESGDVRPLLFIGTEDQRPEELEWLQDVPGAEEAGYEDLAGTVTELRLIVAPPGLPEDVTTCWQDTLYETMTSEEFAAWAEEAGRPIVPHNGEEARAAMEAQIERMQTLVPQLTGQS
jgi:tripartite-type tricarboxylate transporter receptor subunit TctC